MKSFFSNDFEDPKYVAPTSDIGFHWVFGKEGNEELVVQLLFRWVASDCGVPELQQEVEFSQESPGVFGNGDY